jgi:hypothetical protein
MITEQEKLKIFRAWRVSSLELMKDVAQSLKWIKSDENRAIALEIIKREAEFSLYAKGKIDKLNAWK